MPHTSRAWAAGYNVPNPLNIGNNLILHWNGTRWHAVPSPTPGLDSVLSGVAALSHSDAWAVGYYNRTGPARTLILHWNGRVWKQVSSPNPGSRASAGLSSVAVISRTDAWAVGSDDSTAGQDNLILRWNGKAWKQVPSPESENSSNGLRAVAAVSATDIWAVGDAEDGNGDSRTMIEHWNGARWKQVPSPNAESAYQWQDYLDGATATSANNAWAVGDAEYDPVGGEHQASDSPGVVPVIEHWNGTQWKLVPRPALSGSFFRAVTSVSATSAWAVGGGSAVANGTELVEHWNGSTWRKVSTPLINVQLAGVSASSAGKRIFAVGPYNNGSGNFTRSLTLYRC